jgi:hypothetical protein
MFIIPAGGRPNLSDGSARSFITNISTTTGDLSSKMPSGREVAQSF